MRKLNEITFGKLDFVVKQLLWRKFQNSNFINKWSLIQNPLLVEKIILTEISSNSLNIVSLTNRLSHVSVNVL